MCKKNMLRVIYENVVSWVLYANYSYLSMCGYAIFTKVFFFNFRNSYLRSYIIVFCPDVSILILEF